MRALILLLLISVAFAHGDGIPFSVSLNNMYNYPSNTDVHYRVSFNTTIMQANYVTYIINTGGGTCDTCNGWANDPYGADHFINADYNSLSQYDLQGAQLVPTSQYGADTYFVNNIVPMNVDFYKNLWQLMQENEGMNAGCRIYKGAKYDMNKYVKSSLGKIFYVPVGYYYFIANIQGNLIDYAYVNNVAEDIQLVTSTDELPWWIQIPPASHSSMNQRIIIGSVIGGVALLLCLISVAIIAPTTIYCIYSKRLRKFQKLIDEDDVKQKEKDEV